MTGGPYLKFLPAQWITAKKLVELSPLFNGAYPRTDIAAEEVLEPLQGRQIDRLRGYCLWRLVLDLPDSFMTEEDRLKVGQFLVKARVHPAQWASDEARGLAKAVARFKDTRPQYEQIFEALHGLDLEMDEEGTRDEIQELLVITLARFGTSPPQLWFKLDEWENEVQRKEGSAMLRLFNEERQFAEALLKEGDHQPPNLRVIATRSHKTPVLSGDAVVKSEQLTRHTAAKERREKAAKKKPTKKKPGKVPQKQRRSSKGTATKK